MATTPLATQAAVEAALVRPLTSAETPYIDTWISQASALLRAVVPSVDDRIQAFLSMTPPPVNAVDPVVVESVLAGVIKRYLSNPKGLASETESTGPFSHSESYALRTEKEQRGTLQIIEADLNVLFPNRKRLRAGTIRTRPALAPRPVGRYGPRPVFGDAVDAEIEWRDGNWVPDAPVVVPGVGSAGLG